MPTTPGPPPQVLSPNSVLANALLRTIDMIRPKVVANRPKRIVFVVGTQINGAPHLGTNIVQTSAFLLAKLAGGRSPWTPPSGSPPSITPRTR